MGAATDESEAPEPLHLVSRRGPVCARAAPARDGRRRGPVGDESRASAAGSDGALRWVGCEHAELGRLLEHGGEWIQREGPCGRGVFVYRPCSLQLCGTSAEPGFSTGL